MTDIVRPKKERILKEVQLFGRLGSKVNDIKYFKDYLPLDCKIVCEPFGGAFAVSRMIYDDDKYEKYVNDTDPLLYAIYTHPEEYFEFSNKINDITKKHLHNNIVHHKDCHEEISKDETIDKNSPYYTYFMKEKLIRGKMIKTIKNYVCTTFINTMKKIHFTNDDYMVSINKFKNNSDAFLFIDPPYLFSDNSQYYSQSGKVHDMTNILVDLFKLINDESTKCKIMIVINGLDILKYIFENYIVCSYSRIYQLSKKTMSHIVITNYKI